MKNLRVLSVSRTRITDAGLNELRELTNLAQIEAQGTEVTDEGVKALQKTLPNIRIDRQGLSFELRNTARHRLNRSSRTIFDLSRTPLRG